VAPGTRRRKTVLDLAYLALVVALFAAVTLFGKVLTKL
jgi:hypothetical protein